MKQSSTNVFEQTNFNCQDLEFSFGVKVSNRSVEKTAFYDCLFQCPLINELTYAVSERFGDR